MAWTATEELRIQRIEQKLNDVQTALNNVAPKRMVKSLSNIRQAEIDDLKTAIAELTQRVTDLENA